MKKNEKEKNYFKVRAISNSSLRYIVYNPPLFYKFINGDLENKTKDYLELGTAVHMYILENSKFKKAYEVLEYDNPQSPNQIKFLTKVHEEKKITDDKLIKFYKEYYSVKISDIKILEKAKELIEQYSSYFKYLKLSKNKAVLSPQTMRLILDINNNIKEHKKASKLIYNLEADIIEDPEVDIYNEKEIYWNVKKDSREFSHKAMIDRLVIDHSKKEISLIDVKTTFDMADFPNSIKKYNYVQQLAYYTLAINSLFEQDYSDKNIEDYNIKFYIVALETTNSRVEVFNISQKFILTSLPEILSKIDRIYWHMANNKWEHPMEYYTNEGEIDICEATLQDL